MHQVYTATVFPAWPRLATVTIHHIVYANNVGQTCGLGAFGTHYYNGLGGTGVDYVMWVGNLTWNAEPVVGVLRISDVTGRELASPDFAPGPHILVTLNIELHDLRPQLREWRGERG